MDFVAFNVEDAGWRILDTGWRFRANPVSSIQKPASLRLKKWITLFSTRRV